VISYYREPASDTARGTVVPYATEEQAAPGQVGRPTLYLHGSADGCTGVD
jgi:hypothetical protein